MRRARFAVVVVLLALLPVGWLTGCVGERASGNGAGPERSRPEKMEWTELDCAESVVGPADKRDGGSGYGPLVPKPGLDGLSFSGSEETDPWKEPTLVVYGEPECEDPAAGRLLGAHVEPEEDGGLGSLACHGEGSSDITIHGMPGSVREIGDTHWVCWEDPKDLSFAARTEFAVFGRGVSAAAVLRAAKAAEAARVPGAPGYGEVKILTIPAEARPPGLRKLARGSFSLVYDFPFVGRRLSWTNNHADKYVELVVGRANAKDALLSRVAVVAAGGMPVRVRGAVGLVAQDRRYDGYPEQLMTWQEGDRLVFIESDGLSRSELDEFVSRLAPASEADVNGL